MKPRQTLKVVPRVPQRLIRLLDLAANLRFGWDHDTVDLFRHLDRELWESLGHNPVHFLGRIRQERLEQAAADPQFQAHYDRVLVGFEAELARKPLWSHDSCLNGDATIAYFSAEFGLTECLPLYSGGLGVLAGDHLKSASGLGLPLVAVSLLYQKGYFRQYLSSDGWQQEYYPVTDYYNLPVKLVRHEGEPVKVSIPYPGRAVAAQIWMARVGNVRLCLLDTNIPENLPEDRDISRELYGGDKEMRIRQEILLGIGGVRALEALDIHPKVFHMNEGHSAFLALERIRRLLQDTDLSFAEAREATAAGNVFTTHTPVPAGIDVFPAELMTGYFADYVAGLRITMPELLSLGRQNPRNVDDGFSMAVLAIRLASHTNGVSKLHAEVSRRMWHGLWPGFPVDEVPIAAITNGIHLESWISRDMSDLFDRHLGKRWREAPEDPAVWRGIDEIREGELWELHRRKRGELVEFARGRLIAQARRHGATPSQAQMAGHALDPEALTIVFARRVVTYKRATLVFRNLERLARILGSKERPVQLIFAGKAHPEDQAGKEFIRDIVHFARHPDLRARVVFIEDYDMNVARHLVAGADVWLNNPRRPKEASGTSGMKSAANGVLNLSILDGWWNEAYDSGLGWAIGREEEYQDEHYQDQVEANLIHDIIEQEVVPLFYDRNHEGVPWGWVQRMKQAIRTFCPVFNTHRMVREYADQFYAPAAQASDSMKGNDYERARRLASWKADLRRHWADIHIEEVEADQRLEVQVGSMVTVRARIVLGNLRPEDVSVQIYNGRVDSSGSLADAQVVPMNRRDGTSNGQHVYQGSVPCQASGLHGFSIRVVPYSEIPSEIHDLGLIIWQ